MNFYSLKNVIYCSRGRKSSKTGSKAGSRTSSADRGSQDLGSEDNEEGSAIRTSSRGSNCDDDDAKSDSSFAQKMGIKKKKKPPKVNMADFDELFARGMARSAQYESENNKDPFGSPTAVLDETLNSSAGNERYDEHGTRFTPFEVYSHDAAFKKSQKEGGIGYAEKVLCYLDDQAHNPKVELNELVEPVAAERGREKRRSKGSKETAASVAATAKDIKTRDETARDNRKRSREYAKPEDIRLSPLPKRDLFTGAEIPPSPDTLMLKNITDFVSSNEHDAQYTQPVWPATPTRDNLPPLKEPENMMQVTNNTE